jgi:hypothetical protein
VSTTQISVPKWVSKRLIKDTTLTFTGCIIVLNVHSKTHLNFKSPLRYFEGYLVINLDPPRPPLTNSSVQTSISASGIICTPRFFNRVRRPISHTIRFSIAPVICTVSERLVQRLLQQTQGGGQINTAFIEPLHATFRERMACLTRCGRALARLPERLTQGMYLVGGVQSVYLS